MDTKQEVLNDLLQEVALMRRELHSMQERTANKFITVHAKTTKSEIVVNSSQIAMFADHEICMASSDIWVNAAGRAIYNNASTFACEETAAEILGLLYAC